ncbi:hypothetical protein PVAND_016061 [Polypedilum vanderplanki]|uniref:Uncharacterized protein n=1 Tax=Polypedilum vanderplanki TaxID=319348 RepID=A0A9J6BE13_POLVA|nr:hypothetical protein PVAND_016061 [Polypedilum vanderplanki]
MPGAEFLKDTTIFRTEIAMYTGVLSQIQSLLESVGENDLMCPKLIYQTLTPKPVIILEDKIDSSTFNSSLYANKAIAETMFNETLEVFIEKVESWKGFEKFLEPLKNYRKNYMERGLKSYTPSSGPFSFNVLNHGDFHLKIFCIKSMTKEKLKILFSTPTLLDLQVEMMKNGNVQVLLGVCFYPFLLFDFSTLTAEDVTAGPKAFKAKIFESENFKEVMRRELPKFLHKGYFKMNYINEIFFTAIIFAKQLII